MLSLLIRRYSSKVKNPLELIPVAQNYDWGKLGMDSYVAQIASLNSGLKVDEKKPYAELWMGDHEKGSSLVKGQNTPLRKVLKERLTFLFKVLSVRTALSIQVHPNKEEAAQLHKLQPDIYKDPNHKPEMAIALSEFDAMSGFRPINEIHQFVSALPPLVQVIGEDQVSHLKDGKPEDLREAFHKIMTLKPDCVDSILNEICSKHSEVLKKIGLFDLFIKLNEQYPKDVGVLCIFFMNFLKLQPGEAMFTKANQIHAYVAGDCVECMASSDNVIRAGLTPKYRDVKQLLKSTHFDSVHPKDLKFEPFIMKKYFQVFAPPIHDFAIIRLQWPEGETCLEIPPCISGSILIMICGSCSIRADRKEIPLKRGSVIFFPESCCDSYNLQKSKNDYVDAYMALTNRFQEEC